MEQERKETIVFEYRKLGKTVVVKMELGETEKPENAR